MTGSSCLPPSWGRVKPKINARATARPDRWLLLAAIDWPYTRWPAFATFRALMTLDDFLLEAEDKMSKTEHVVINEFAGVRTGKASPALVENILVEVYGSQMRIRELAGITTPEPRTLTIQPWDV